MTRLNTAMYQSVSRVRIRVGPRRTLLLLTTQHKAYAADGMQKLRWEWIINFAADARNVNVDDIIERSIANGSLPHVAGHHLAGDDRAAVYEQVLKQIEFASGQFNRGGSAIHSVAACIHAKVGYLQNRGRVRIGAAMQRTETG